MDVKYTVSKFSWSDGRKHEKNVNDTRCKDTKVLKSVLTFLIYKSDTVNELPVHNFIFKYSRRHCPNIY